jgi:hypothetical protein
MTLSAHQRTIGRSQVHITPRVGFLDRIEAAAGQRFDLDPCGADPRPWDCALTTYTVRDDGLVLPWFGRVYLNPPFDTRQIRAWLEKMAAHNRGLALVHARTETQWFKVVRESASGLLFLEGRMRFHKPDGTFHTKWHKKRQCFEVGDSGAPVVLASYGEEDLDILAAAGFRGLFVPLIMPRSIIAMFAGTWAELVAAHAGDDVFHIDDLYRRLASHPKAGRNAHVRAKLRQVLNGDGFERVAQGRYRRAA